MSFIIIPARKGFQAASVTIADPPKEEPVSTQETTGFGTDSAWGESVEENKAPADKTAADSADGAWGEAVEEEKAPAPEPTDDTADDAWGEPVTEEVTPHKDTEIPPEKAMEEVHLSDNNDQSAAATDGEWGSGEW